MRKLLSITLLAMLLSPLSLYADTITKKEVLAAQKGWGEGIVTIGAAKDPKAAAMAHLDEFYAFGDSIVLFKPTLAAADQFRGDVKGALSYFIGNDSEYAEDKGFALAPYVKVGWDNEGIIIDGDSAMAMGNYFFTKTNGDVVKVEYSFGYFKDTDGKLKINLHHSSLPFSPKK